MYRSVVRVLLGAALAIVIGSREAPAQCTSNCRPTAPSTTPPPTIPVLPPSSSPNNTGSYAILGVLGGVIAIGILRIQFPIDQSATSSGNPRIAPNTTQLPGTTTTQLPGTPQLPGNPPSLTGPSGPSGGTGPGGGTGGPGTTVQALRSGFNLPPAGETRFVSNHLIVDIPADVQIDVRNAMAAGLSMTPLDSFTSVLTGRTLHLWRIDGGIPAPDAIRNAAGVAQIAGAQVDFYYRGTQSTQTPATSEQYVPQKLHLSEAHRLARGNRVLVAVIDSEVDATHPELAGAVTANFESSTESERPHMHGTGMAGAIASRRNLVGVAPEVGLLTVRAFSSRANDVEGTTFNILKGLDWAATEKARVVNMSFAGPSDPRLRDALQKAYARGMVLIAAAGNAGPRSPPLFPAAYPDVIAVTATNSNDGLFAGANRGNYIAVAAPGVEVLAPAPDGGYQFTTGTSVAAAEVSGVAALLLDRNPSLTPAEVRRILMATAKDLGPKGRDREFGAGLVDALAAVNAVKPR
jgi:Subtilase family